MSSEPGEAKAYADIEKYGCHIIHVFEDEEGPCFTYSIGIEKTSNQPELLVTGLKREIALWIINEYNRRIQTGEIFKANEMYAGFLEGFDVQFRSVLKQYYRDYFGWGRWLYDGDGFRVFQLIWPTTKGVWPWDNDATEEYKYLIPLLCEPFDGS